MKIALVIIAVCGMVSCSKTDNSLNNRSSIGAIVDGTFATDTAMQDERVQQGDYIEEQEQRYEE